MNVEASSSNRWKVRDFCVATGLFAATALWVFWQNSRVAVLWDLGYLLNTSHRIAIGQVPYRDFSLVHPPITFLIQAIIERLFGRDYQFVIAYAAVAGGIASVVAWRLLLHVFGSRPHAWLSSILLAAPLAVIGIYGIYPHPVYDADAVLAVLAALLLLQRAGRREASWKIRWLAGAGCVVPLFVKQNIGLPFLVAALAIVAILLVNQRWRKARGRESSDALGTAAILQMIGGIALGLAAGLTFLEVICGLGNYRYWTLQFASARRLPGMAMVEAVYQEPALWWMLPLLAVGLLLLCSKLSSSKLSSSKLSSSKLSLRRWAWVAGLALAAAPFAVTLAYLLFERNAEDRADRLLALWPLILLVAEVTALLELRRGLTIARLTPFLILAAVQGTFLSQEVWGSTYAIWPLLILLAACPLAALPARAGKAIPALSAVIGVTLLICGGLYAASLERLDYIYNPEDEPLVKATLPALHGMAARGPYLPDFEQLVRFADAQVPAGDGILLLPGEEPFFYATGRVPRFPVVLFDHTTDPYSPEELIAEADRRDIRWVVVKTRLQSNEDPLPERERLMELVQGRYQLFRKLEGYDVYRRR